ncbi:MAG: alkaline phosphatase [Bryobacterales bacterium]|nr:alkaline phosphatase [Bryobacterales bacterium]
MIPFLRLYLLVAALVLAGGAEPLVIVIGYDGLSPRGIREARTPAFDWLTRTGTSTMKARAVMPTSSSSNWASMIMGVGPEQHGVTSNEWQPDKFEIAPVVPGPAGFSETMFSVVRRLHPAAVIGVFHDWKDFGRLVESGVPNVKEHGEGPEDTMRRAIAFLKERKPTLLFIHLDHVDHAGHDNGWYSAPYTQAVELADRLTEELVSAVTEAGRMGETTFILSADHGGTGKKHGGNTMEEIEIPWIVNGPGVKRGHVLDEPVNVHDTACAW